MTTRTTLRGLAVATAAVLTLTACGVGAENGDGAKGDNSKAGTTSVAELPGRAEAPNPHDLRGLNTVANLGDIEPVAEAPTPTLPVTFTDAKQHQVEVKDTSRILALDLYGTLSRTVEGLGLGGDIVGRAVSSTEPALATLPVVTQGGHNLNVESILQLRPSVVLVDDSIGPAEAIDQLRDAGVTVAVLDPHRTVESLEDDVMLVAGALGVREQGTALGRRARKQMDTARSEVDGLAPEGTARLRMAFLYVRGNGGVFFVLGKGSGADAVISALDGVDVASEAGITDTVPANAESLATLDPELILVMHDGLESTGGLDGLLARPGVAQTVAGKNTRVVALPDGEAASMGPQAGLSLARFAQAVYLGENVG